MECCVHLFDDEYKRNMGASEMYNYPRVAYYLTSLLRNAYWKKDELSKYQDQKVKSVVKYAYDHSAFYHRTYRALGIRPDDIQCKDDLRKLPIIKKNDLQKHPEQIISDEFDINKLRILKTSGSSGRPLSVYFSQKEHEFRMAKMLRANISCGQKSRDRWFVITAPGHVNKQGGVRKLLGIFSPFSISVFEKLETQISLIEEYKPNVIEGYSS